MDQRTIAVYDEHAADWQAARQPVWRADARRWAHGLSGLRADLGCGPGQYTNDLGTPVVGLDASFEMLSLARQRVPDAAFLCGDLAQLPFTSGGLSGAWAAMSYHHLPQHQLPLAFAQLHRCLAPDAPVQLIGLHGEFEGHDLPDDDFPGRLFSCWTQSLIDDLLVGAGFRVESMEVKGRNLWVACRRADSLPDYVGADMKVLVVGLNPSLHAAASGVGYSGPGNRFWPAAREAGLASHPDPWHSLASHGMGMTDLVKRATPRAAELTTPELREGTVRVERLVRRLQPGVVAFAGLQGYRVAVDRRAQPGWQDRDFGGRPAYLLPSPSGLNAATSLADLVGHLFQIAQNPLKTGHPHPIR